MAAAGASFRNQERGEAKAMESGGGIEREREREEGEGTLGSRFLNSALQSQGGS